MNGSLDIMKKRVSANYKLAVPQYYEGKIQLLLPLCLMSDDKPDVAIAVLMKTAHILFGKLSMRVKMIKKFVLLNLNLKL